MIIRNIALAAAGASLIGVSPIVAMASAAEPVRASASLPAAGSQLGSLGLRQGSRVGAPMGRSNSLLGAPLFLAFLGATVITIGTIIIVNNNNNSSPGG